MNTPRLPYLALLLACLGTPFSFANEDAIRAVNEEVAKLDKRMKEGSSLKILKVEYDYRDATEGVPPNFVFYFEFQGNDASAKRVLRACSTHVGHEVFSTDFHFYFDVTGKPIKYLATNSGVSGGHPPSRAGIIYGRDGKTLWTSGSVQPQLPFNEIQALFLRLDSALAKF